MQTHKPADTYNENDKRAHDKVLDLIHTSWDMRRSHPKEALEISLQARKEAEQLNFKEGIAYSFRNTGTAYYILSQYNLALADLEKAYTLFIELNDKHAIGSTLRNIGNVYHSMNLFEASIESYNKALLITHAEKDLQGTAYNLGNIGHVYQKMKQFAQARKYLLEAKEILEQINDTLGLADLLNNLGNVLLAEGGDAALAKSYIERSFALAQSIHHLRGMATAELSLGQLYILSDKNDQALKTLEDALKIAKEVGELLLISEVLRSLSEVLEKKGDYKKALACFREYEQKKSSLFENDRHVLMEIVKLKDEVERSHNETDELQKIKNEIEEKNKVLERLSIVASETENPILIMDADGTLDWVNTSFERLNGMQLKEFKEKYGNTIQQISNNPNIENILQQCMDTKAPVRYESANQLDNGTVVWESTTLSPIYKNGQLAKFIIIDNDITDRKLHEETIKQKNKDITDSILYAKRLQEALLPPISELTDIFSKAFIVFKPKDIVSGDFYWYSSTNEVGLLAVADCTGHGVPGAFMSVIGNEMLNVCLHDPSVRNPSSALNMLDGKIKQVFKKGKAQSQTQDGMDIGLLVWHRQTNFIQFAGAKRPLIHIRNKEVQEYAADRFSIGGKDELDNKEFTDKEFYAQPGDMIYLFTDGYPDQFGGPKGKKFMHKNFVRLLCEISELPEEEQKIKIEDTLKEWMGALEQVDDISVVGLRITGKQ